MVLVEKGVKKLFILCSRLNFTDGSESPIISCSSCTQFRQPHREGTARLTCLGQPSVRRSITWDRWALQLPFLGVIQFLKGTEISKGNENYHQYFAFSFLSFFFIA
jgi:hypothetical protein